MTNVTISFRITNFPFLSSNVPGLPAYGVVISQLIRYARTCSSYECFILRATGLSNKLREHGYVKERLKSSLKKIYGRYRDLIKQYKVPHSRMLNDVSLTKYNDNLPSTRLYTNPWHVYSTRPFTDLWGFRRTFATGVAWWQGTITPPATWSCSIWNLHINALLVETNPFLELVVIFPGLFTSNIPRYFLDFAQTQI